MSGLAASTTLEDLRNLSPMQQAVELWCLLTGQDAGEAVIGEREDRAGYRLPAAMERREALYIYLRRLGSMPEGTPGE
jgi:hypothetical protein